jgi:ubiquinone/menaquinone biosynthesis C-methylase UbiE
MVLIPSKEEKVMVATAARAINYWPDTKCARAFWGQRELPPYRRLLADTTDWLDPRSGERWLDLGCGSGQLTRALWGKSHGQVGEVIGLDCAAVNERAIQKLCGLLRPTPAAGQVRFVQADFSKGLPDWADASVNGVVSGLAIQYAESYSPQEDRWTTAAYDRLLHEVHRVLRPGGRFVFSVNVPDPSWGKVALSSLTGVLQASRPVRYVRDALRMWRYGGWLTHEARRGRFHYLPLENLREKLSAAGFTGVDHRLSFAGQAYVVRCLKAA